MKGKNPINSDTVVKQCQTTLHWITPLNQNLYRLLKKQEDSTCVQTLLVEASKENPNVIIELSNDDWMKDPDVELPPVVLLGKYNTQPCSYLILVMYDDGN